MNLQTAWGLATFDTPDPVEECDLHPATEPEEIAHQHVQEVSRAVRELGTQDVKQLSDYLDLPEWNVLRALASLGLIDPVREKVGAGRTSKPTPRSFDRIKAVMGNGEEWTSRAIVIETGLSLATVLAVFGGHPQEFIKRKNPSRRTNPCRVFWRLRQT